MENTSTFSKCPGSVLRYFLLLLLFSVFLFFYHIQCYIVFNSTLFSLAFLSLREPSTSPEQADTLHHTYRGFVSAYEKDTNAHEHTDPLAVADDLRCMVELLGPYRLVPAPKLVPTRFLECLNRLGRLTLSHLADGDAAFKRQFAATMRHAVQHSAVFRLLQVFAASAACVYNRRMARVVLGNFCANGWMLPRSAGPICLCRGGGDGGGGGGGSGGGDDCGDYCRFCAIRSVVHAADIENLLEIINAYTAFFRVSPPPGGSGDGDDGSEKEEAMKKEEEEEEEEDEEKKKKQEEEGEEEEVDGSERKRLVAAGLASPFGSQLMVGNILSSIRWMFPLLYCFADTPLRLRYSDSVAAAVVGLLDTCVFAEDRENAVRLADRLLFFEEDRKKTEREREREEKKGKNKEDEDILTSSAGLSWGLIEKGLLPTLERKLESHGVEVHFLKVLCTSADDVKDADGTGGGGERVRDAVGSSRRIIQYVLKDLEGGWEWRKLKNAVEFLVTVTESPGAGKHQAPRLHAAPHSVRTHTQGVQPPPPLPPAPPPPRPPPWVESFHATGTIGGGGGGHSGLKVMRGLVSRVRVLKLERDEAKERKNVLKKIELVITRILMWESLG
jgi:hypothetical protein